MLTIQQQYVVRDILGIQWQCITGTLGPSPIIVRPSKLSQIQLLRISVMVKAIFTPTMSHE